MCILSLKFHRIPIQDFSILAVLPLKYGPGPFETTSADSIWFPQNQFITINSAECYQKLVTRTEKFEEVN